jgi:hypothetical protein
MAGQLVDRAVAEAHLAEAERHVAEARVRIDEQARLTRQLIRDGHKDAAAQARQILKTLRESLRVMLGHRDIVREEVRSTSKRGSRLSGSD